MTTRPIAAVLFDIDGTLVKVPGWGKRALAAATEGVFEVPRQETLNALDQVDFRGNTDQLILGRMATLLRRREYQVPARLYESAQWTGEYVHALSQLALELTVAPLPGVLELVAQLEAAGITVGCLTGNIRAAATEKLRHVGLERLAQRGGFGDEGATRSDIALTAVGRLCHSANPPGDIWVVGDTEHDVAAARAAGARCVAVSTGWTTIAELRTAEPDLLLESLAPPDRLLDEWNLVAS